MKNTNEMNEFVNRNSLVEGQSKETLHSRLSTFNSRLSTLVLIVFCFLFGGKAWGQTTVAIGDGTSAGYYCPIGTYYNYSITEQLYTASEIGMAGTIESISFYYASSTAKDFPIDVYMKNVSATNLSTGISLADAELVFSGTFSVTGEGWFTINLDNQFEYDGTSNLLIGVNKGYLYWYSGSTWRYTSTSNMARYTQNDNTEYTTSTTPGTVTDNRPNIQLEITPASVSCSSPDAILASSITSNGASLSWSGGSGTYNVEYKKTSDADWSTLLSGTTQTSTTLSTLDPNTGYQVRVQSVCSGENSTYRSTSFRTACGTITSFPWSETFESYADGNFTDPCWVNEHISGGGSDIFKVYTYANGTNSTHQLQLPDMSSGTLTKLVLPEMNFGAVSTEYQFLIDVYRSNSTYNSNNIYEGVRVYASTDGNIVGATEICFIPRQYNTSNAIIPEESSVGWYTYELNIPITTGTCYIILQGESQYCTSTYMDNFEVKVAPSCRTSISTFAEWQEFCSNVNSGTCSYAGRTVTLENDISITTTSLSDLVGTSDHPFKGTFDGQGNKLTVNINISGTADSYQGAAPFSHISGATIENLEVDGTVQAQAHHAGGLVSKAVGSNENTIRNCLVHTDVTNNNAGVNNTNFIGGIIGQNNVATTNIIGCVYDGTLTSQAFKGGMFGFTNAATITIQDSYFAGDYDINGLASGYGSFSPVGCRSASSFTLNLTLSNFYYNMGDGTFASDHTGYNANTNSNRTGTAKQAYTVTGATGVTVAMNGSPTEYDVSGIDAYTAGIVYNGNIYGGDGDNIDLYLSYGGTFAEYVADHGTLSGSGVTGSNDEYTLTMVADNTVISVSMCATPSDLDVSNIMPTSATLNWSGNAGQYNVRYRNTEKWFRYGFESAEPWAVDDFSPCTTYDGDGGVTYGFNWSFPNANYIGACIAFNNDNDGSSNMYSHGGDAFGVMFNSSEGASNDWLILPELTIESGYVFSFWAREITDQYGDEVMNVGIYGSTSGTFSSNLASTITVSGTDWTQYSYNLSAYVGQSVKLAINCVSNDIFGLMIDDIFVGNPTDDSWDEVIFGVSYPYTITGLTPETEYEVQVQADCGSDGESLWTGTTFTTPDPCSKPHDLSAEDIAATSATLSWIGAQESYDVKYREVITAPVEYTYDFEDGTTQGWTTIDADGHGDAWSVYSYDGNIGSYCMKAYYNSYYDHQDYLVSPEIPLGGTLSFYARRSGTYDDRFRVYLSTSGNNSSDFTIELTNGNVTPNSSYDEYTYDLSAYSGTGYVAIVYTAVADQHWLGIDDITIVKPGEYGNWITLNGVTSPSTITGLSPETSYEWQVQGVNCDGNGTTTDWSDMINFTTTAPTITASASPAEGGTVAFMTGAASNSSHTHLPLDSYRDNSFSQQIYTPEEVGGGIINSISLYSVDGNNNDGIDYTRTLAVYLAHTNKAEFSDGRDWISNSDSPDMVMVYSGSVTFNCGEWNTINFTTPFTYDGTRNLVLTISDNTGESAAALNYLDCKTFTPSSGGNCSLNFGFAQFDPSGSSENGELLTVKNQILINSGSSSITRTFPEDATCTLVATANDCYNFAKWTENDTQLSTDSTYSVTASGDRTLVANFESRPALTASIDNATDYCRNISATALSTSPAGGSENYSYQWQSSADNSEWSSTGTNSNECSISTASVGTTYYRVIVTDTHGCGTATAESVQITVNDKPSVSFTQPAAVCSGAVLSLSASVTDNGGLTTNDGYTISEDQSSWTEFTNGSQVTYGQNNYYIKYKATNDCGDSEIIRQITVHSLPTASIDGTNPLPVCVYTQVTLTASGAGDGGSYDWNNELGSGASKTITVTEAKDYTVIVTDANTCTAEATKSVTLKIPGNLPSTYAPEPGIIWTGYESTDWDDQRNWLFFNGDNYTPIVEDLDSTLRVVLRTGGTEQCILHDPVINNPEFDANAGMTIRRNITVANGTELNIGGALTLEGGTLTLGGSTYLAVGDTVLIANGATVSFSASDTLVVSGNFALSGNINFVDQGLTDNEDAVDDPTDALVIGGDLTINGASTFSPAGGSIVFARNSGNRRVRNNTGRPLEFFKVELDDERTRSGVPHTVFPDGTIIKYTAIFSYGIWDGDLIFAKTGNALVKGGFESYASGNITKIGKDKSFSFPTGGNDVLGSIAAKIPTDVQVSAKFNSKTGGYDQEHDGYPRWWNNNDMCDGSKDLDHVSNYEYWTVRANTTTTLTDLTFTAEAADRSSHFNSASSDDESENEEAIRLAMYNGCWKNLGGAGNVTVDEGKIEIGISELSLVASGAKGIGDDPIITLGSTTKTTILPIELTSFTATCDGRSALVEWTTATERNNDYFSLERSDDAINFTEVARVAGAGNSIEPLNYSYNDYGIHGGDNYYRLVQVDYDGTRTVSEVIVANCIEPESDGDPDVLAYPNPFNGELTLVLDNFSNRAATIEVYDMLGKLIYTEKASAPQNSYETILNLSNLPSGAYTVRVSTTDFVINKNVVKN